LLLVSTLRFLHKLNGAKCGRYALMSIVSIKVDWVTDVLALAIFGWQTQIIFSRKIGIFYARGIRWIWIGLPVFASSSGFDFHVGDSLILLILLICNDAYSTRTIIYKNLFLTIQNIAWCNTFKHESNYMLTGYVLTTQIMP